MKKLIFLILLTTCYILLATDKAEASALSLGVNPAIIVVQVDPPASIKTPITIKNLSDKSTALKILFRPFLASDSENGSVQYVTNEKGIPGPDQKLFEKVQVMDNENNIDTITLGPKQQKTLSVHIGIPENEPIADYYFSIIFLNNPPAGGGQNTNSGSQAIGGIATNILLSIGKEPAQGTVTEFTAPGFVEHGPVPFTVRIRNTGKHVIAPKGNIIIKNMFGQAVGKVDLLPVNILVNSTRAIPDVSQNPEKQKSSTRHALPPTPPVSYWSENFLLGFYTATLTISLSNSGPVYTKTIYFGAFPLTIMIGFVISCLIVLFIRKRLKNRLKDS